MAISLVRRDVTFPRPPGGFGKVLHRSVRVRRGALTSAITATIVAFDLTFGDLRHRLTRGLSKTMGLVLLEKKETMTIDTAVKCYPSTKAADWRELPNGAVAHVDAVINDACLILGDAVFRGGVFYGGEFYSGVFYGGEFYSGEFYGGVFYGGEFYGGVFRGGEFYGGIFRGGRFYGGKFCGGKFYGGRFYGGRFYSGGFRSGEFYGGIFHSGEFFATPLQLFGILPWPVNASGLNTIQIGCERHTIAEWKEQLSAIVWKYGAEVHEPKIRDKVLPICEQWFIEHPDCIGDVQESKVGAASPGPQEQTP